MIDEASTAKQSEFTEAIGSQLNSSLVDQRHCIKKTKDICAEIIKETEAI